MSTAESIETLERVAAMLPEDAKERFLLVCQRFRNVPEDDEFLLLLEAICLNTLLWKEVPEKIHSILNGASPIPANHERLKSMIDASVREAVPSYEDLKQASGKLEESILTLKKQPTSSPVANRTGGIRYLVMGILIGFTLPYVLSVLFSA